MIPDRRSGMKKMADGSLIRLRNVAELDAWGSQHYALFINTRIASLVFTDKRRSNDFRLKWLNIIRGTAIYIFMSAEANSVETIVGM